MDNMDENAQLHSAGATVRHLSPFTHLPSHKNEHRLSADFIQNWVVPYYMEIGSSDNTTWTNSIKKRKNDITEELCLQLLGEFNWRTRLVGAYFAAVKGYHQLIDVIGTLLLKSEVCYVGHIYALTLAFFNTEKSIQYLDRYLEYYLRKPDLYFDQKYVLEALLFLDEKNRTTYISKFENTWSTFEQERTEREKGSLSALAAMLKNLGETAAAEHLEMGTPVEKSNNRKTLNSAYYHQQIKILHNLSTL